MNTKLIEQMAAPCAVEYGPPVKPGHNWIFTHAELHLFAETIVRRCADVASRGHGYGPHNAILSEFGIEK